MLDYEKNIYQKGYQYIVGCDEAGRGPLCGPVVCASCILPPDYHNEMINDSKKLTAKKRELLFEEIKKVAIAYDIVAIPPHEIDQINIYEASRKGMTMAINNLSISPDYIITDCMPLFGFDGIPQENLVKGDAKAQCVAAASILAKVTRDHLMDELDRQYPQYNFKKHKGYPTKEHLELINKYGIIEEIYRLSYKPVRDVINKKITLF
jgi:ribonuclease HII